MIAVAIGVACALIGVGCQPDERIRGQRERWRWAVTLAVIFGVLIGWMIWCGQVLATMLPFIAVTAVFGELKRARSTK